MQKSSKFFQVKEKKMGGKKVVIKSGTAETKTNCQTRDTGF